jgi:16S rRNA (guanine1516-N2)-methyltransferase
MSVSVEPVVFVPDPAHLGAASRVANSLNLALTETLPGDDSMLLCCDGDGLSIGRAHSKQKLLRVDFLSPSTRFRQHAGGGLKQAIARAVGVTGKIKPRVLDLTAGLGRDGFVLASLGCTLTLLEKSTVVAALLEDGMARARGDPATGPIISRMRVEVAESVTWLDREGADQYDVIYIDPMFPPRKKSARVKGEMQLMHDLVGVNDDVDALLSAALAAPVKRVVVKRPKLAAPSALKKPGFVLKGRSSRFDVYHPELAR